MMKKYLSISNSNIHYNGGVRASALSPIFDPKYIMSRGNRPFGYKYKDKEEEEHVLNTSADFIARKTGFLLGKLPVAPNRFPDKVVSSLVKAGQHYHFDCCHFSVGGKNYVCTAVFTHNKNGSRILISDAGDLHGADKPQYMAGNLFINDCDALINKFSYYENNEDHLQLTMNINNGISPSVLTVNIEKLIAENNYVVVASELNKSSELTRTLMKHFVEQTAKPFDNGIIKSNDRIMHNFLEEADKHRVPYDAFNLTGELSKKFIYPTNSIIVPSSSKLLLNNTASSKTSQITPSINIGLKGVLDTSWFDK